jgi:hypothetical protein
MNASELIDNRIAELGDWRGKVIAQVRRIVHAAASDIVEEWKWDTPVWSQNGNVLAAGAFQDHVKLNFFKGASLQDPHHLFNAGLEAKATRAIDIYEGEKIEEAALKELITSAVALNSAIKKSPIKPKSTTAKEPKKAKGYRT